jgi:hypothetical protein
MDVNSDDRGGGYRRGYGGEHHQQQQPHDYFYDRAPAPLRGEHRPRSRSRERFPPVRMDDRDRGRGGYDDRIYDAPPRR